jgi:hypothetical protein
MLPGLTYEEGTVDLCAGDVLLAFTDGVTEAHNPDDAEFGEERLKDLVRQAWHLPANDIAARVSAALKDWIRDAEQFDDLTFVCDEGIAEVIGSDILNSQFFHALTPGPRAREDPRRTWAGEQSVKKLANSRSDPRAIDVYPARGRNPGGPPFGPDFHRPSPAASTLSARGRGPGRIDGDLADQFCCRAACYHAWHPPGRGTVTETNLEKRPARESFSFWSVQVRRVLGLYHWHRMPWHRG